MNRSPAESEQIAQLMKIGIVQATAERLFDVGIKSPKELARADTDDIVNKFQEKAKKKELGYYKVGFVSVKEWIKKAQSGNWEYSVADMRYFSIRQRADEKNIPFDMDWELFRKFYGKDAEDRQCLYCEIKEAHLKKLFSSGEIFTVRNRGDRMEIDRKDPDPKKGYIHKDGDTNIVMCCYWCNNAKTDEFKYPEFIDIIGPAIKRVWKARLGRCLP